MARTFVIVCESATIVANLNVRFFEIEELDRRSFWQSDIDLEFPENGIERILREHVLDVCDEQFLMLLLMMNTENEDRLDFIDKLLIGIGKQTVDMRINRRAVALRLLDCMSRN